MITTLIVLSVAICLHLMESKAESYPEFWDLCRGKHPVLRFLIAPVFLIFHSLL